LLVEMSQGHVVCPDFALYSTGASVIPSLTSPTYRMRPSTFLGKTLGYFTGIGVLNGRSPVTALDHDIHDGHCWPFAGSHGQLGIVLGNLVYIDAITIEHVAAAVAVSRRTSAPKDMEVWAMVEGRDNFIRIVSLQYDMYSPNNIQTFPVDAEIRNLRIDFGVVVLVVKSNWDMAEYTCLYRIQVHGQR
ncbi:UNC-like C-terminal-domain-containing protein, partial [Mycena galopus ATCC 62051]